MSPTWLSDKSRLLLSWAVNTDRCSLYFCHFYKNKHFSDRDTVCSRIYRHAHPSYFPLTNQNAWNRLYFLFTSVRRRFRIIDHGSFLTIVKQCHSNAVYRALPKIQIFCFAQLKRILDKKGWGAFLAFFLLVFLSLAVSFEPFEVFDKIKVSTTDIKVNADFILEEGELTHQEFFCLKSSSSSV